MRSLKTWIKDEIGATVKKTKSKDIIEGAIGISAYVFAALSIPVIIGYIASLF